ncbi:MAG: metallophosphoesterase [SAR324 cluster bacterium]|nr:metallophosphoesterase [SAR324 cluster bacterium]
MPFTIVHLSDLHFHSYPKTFQEWTSKRALGALNLFLRKKKHYPLERAKKLVHTLQELQWDHLVISGDLTYLALEEGFARARCVLEPLLDIPEKVTIIPGNHDRYVEAACQPDLFEKTFSPFIFKGEASSNGMGTQQLTEQWHLVSWDCTHPNDWLTASGTVRRKTMLATEAYIRAQPAGSRFIITNHYPVWFPPGEIIESGHELYNLAHAQHWVMQQPQVIIYLHGHVHRNWNHKLSRDGNPLYMVNSASSTSVSTAQHSSFHRIHIDGLQVSVEPMKF